jgi:hypothetical protein
MFLRKVAIAFLTIALMAWPTSASAQCRECDFVGCDQTEHENHDCLTCLTGNIDGEHGCWGYTCEYMQGQGVHVPEHDCWYSYAALDVLRVGPQIASEDVPAFVAEYGGHVVAIPELRVIQVLDCAADRVIAQFRYSEALSEDIGRPGAPASEPRLMVMPASQ